MNDAVAPADWATRSRRRWSASRLAAATLLHLLVLAALVLGPARVRLAPHGPDRAMTLVDVALAPMKPPPTHALPAPRPRVREAAPSTAPRPRARRPPEVEPLSQPITLPSPVAPIASPVAIAAKPPASAPSAPLPDIRYTAATRDAIRAAARGTRLAELGDAATHEEQGSVLPYAGDEACPSCTRNLAPPKARGERLAHAVKAAGRPDCLQQSAGMGAFALPVLVVTEAVGQCSN